jgi:uncharacterized membrane protein
MDYACYKCQTEKDLSVKRTNKDNVLYICRACRRADYYARKAKGGIRYTTDKQWNAMAKEINSKAGRKYMDDSMLIARGLA